MNALKSAWSIAPRKRSAALARCDSNCANVSGSSQSGTSRSARVRTSSSVTALRSSRTAIVSVHGVRIDAFWGERRVTVLADAALAQDSTRPTHGGEWVGSYGQKRPDRAMVLTPCAWAARYRQRSHLVRI